MIAPTLETKRSRPDGGIGGMVSVHSVLVSFVALMCLLVGLARDVGAQEAPTSHAPIYLGIFADPQKDPLVKRSQERAIEVREGSLLPNSGWGIDRTFALHLHYYDWTDLAQHLEVGGVFQPDNDLLGDINHGRVPVISWKCDDRFFDSDGLIANSDNEDVVILQTARALAQYPGPVFLRWYWEFNVFHKNQNCRGDNSQGVQSQQVFDNFIGAWQHIRTLFRQANADNVIFLWNPGVYKANSAEDARPFYPGNDYVDWIGVDTYQKTTETFAQDFQLFYDEFTRRKYDDKFLMVGENGTLPIEQTGVEQQWGYLTDPVTGLLADAGSYPLLRAYCYFERGQKPTKDWVLDGTTANMGGLAAMKLLGESPLFAPMFPMDTTPPVTTATVPMPSGLNGWYIGPTTVTLTATDDLSGVFQTYFSRDNGATWTAGTSVSVKGDAIHTILYRSTDYVGKVETPKSVTVELDNKPPVTIATTRLRTVGGVPVLLEVDLKAVDNLSGVAKTEYSLDRGASWGTGKVIFMCGGTKTIQYFSTDVAGNVERQKSITLSTPSCGGP